MQKYAEALARTGQIIIISDKDQFIAVAGASKKELITKSISRDLEDVINERENIVAAKGDKNFINLMNDDESDYTYQVIAPILSEGDAIGAVIILTKDAKIKFGDTEMKLASTAASFLGRQMEQ